MHTYQLKQKKNLPSANHTNTLASPRQSQFFSQKQSPNYSPTSKLRRHKKKPFRNETGSQHNSNGISERQSCEFTVRNREKKRPTYRFTYNGSQLNAEQGRTPINGNFRLVIEGGHCGKDLLKLNRHKLEAMIAKIQNGASAAMNYPNSNMAEELFLKCQGGNVFCKGESRRISNWKGEAQIPNSPAKFDTRQYLICQSISKDARETSKKSKPEDRSKSRKLHAIDKCANAQLVRKFGMVSSEKLSKKKYFIKPPSMMCKTEEKFGSNSVSYLSISPSWKGVGTFTQLNVNTLQGWQSTLEGDLFECEGVQAVRGESG